MTPVPHELAYACMHIILRTLRVCSNAGERKSFCTHIGLYTAYATFFGELGCLLYIRYRTYSRYTI